MSIKSKFFTAKINNSYPIGYVRTTLLPLSNSTSSIIELQKFSIKPSHLVAKRAIDIQISEIPIGPQIFFRIEAMHPVLTLQ